MTLLNTKSTYQSLQSFSTIGEMNAAVKYYKDQYKSQLTKSTYAVLDFISQWACKFIGVCYLSQKKIAEELNISYKTVQRSIAVLVDLNVIKKYDSKRHNGDKRRSTNILVIQNSSHVQTECPNKETLLNTQNINNTNDTVIATQQVDKETLIKHGLKTKLPQPLQFLSAFFDHDDLYQIVGTIYKAKAATDRNIQIEEHEQEYRESILSVINAYKRDKAKSLHGLLFYSIKAVTRSIQMKSRLYDAFGL
ncbi:MarR family transcriptional regulator [Lysinibacillus agricola]|uniref:MarR family transcriptional regulator n=1 Tax=Lysinibacillus agricola TaxID=2590012 RepID=UPI003C206B46